MFDYVVLVPKPHIYSKTFMCLMGIIYRGPVIINILYYIAILSVEDMVPHIITNQLYIQYYESVKYANLRLSIHVNVCMSLQRLKKC